MFQPSHITAHMDVISSDHKVVGKVDRMEGADKIKLTKTSSPNGERHHLIPVEWVDHVDQHVHLNKTGTEVVAWIDSRELSGEETSYAGGEADTASDGKAIAFERLLGRAALQIWNKLPQDAQEALFEAAIGGSNDRNSLAVFLHDRHPKTAHPPKPTALA